MNPEFRAYTRTLLLTVAVTLGLVALVNTVVDPFRLFRVVSIPNVNVDKPEMARQGRMTKAHDVHRIKPAGLILGTSRAEFALDPDHPAWKVPGPVYNFAVSSGRITEAYYHLLHANEQRPLERVVLELEMFMFDSNWQEEAGFDRARLDLPGHSGRAGRAHDLAVSALSWSALVASYDTFRGQGDVEEVNYLANGAREPQRNALLIRKRGGHRAAFLSNLEYDLKAPDGWATLSLVDAEGRMPGFDALRAIVRHCIAHGIELNMYISPAHALKLEGLWQFGLWQQYEDWKRGVVKLVHEEASGNARVSLWDFSGFHHISTEPIPPPGDAETLMRWYWEGSHYRKETGDLILSRLLGGGTPPEGEGFGVRLTPDNIETHLAFIREARQRWEAEHPAEGLVVAQLIASTAAARARLARQSEVNREHGTQATLARD